MNNDLTIVTIVIAEKWGLSGGCRITAFRNTEDAAAYVRELQEEEWDCTTYTRVIK
jgi:hypothetical protein